MTDPPGACYTRFMKCPRCASDSIAPFVSTEGVTIDFCGKCHGIWFDSGELAEYLELRHDLVKEAPGKATALKCPKCAEVKLQERRYLPDAGPMIDWCPKCLGVWLDKREIVELEAVAAKLVPAATRYLRTVRQLEEKGYVIRKR